jgi:lipopolysaccharide transport system ATP-binding protein
MRPTVTCEDLGKAYQLQHCSQGPGGYRTLREDLVAALQAPVRWLRGENAGARPEEFWALRDVCFQVGPGEVIGLIGGNGAGKSTLLKILSRITAPTRGTVELYGRVGSLLEVGTGFHPELTGRENIYLNGSILGMSRREIARKFDEIVDFSGVEKFLDTPVKRYSSGMYVRLAFAVAAHLETEVLLVDEVLAVGDQTFQQKCLGKMDSVARSGRTVFFVSHQLAAVESLCSRVLVLEKGSVAMDGDPQAGINYYIESLRKTAASQSLAERSDRGGTGAARFTAVRLYDGEGRLTDQIACGGQLVLEADAVASDPLVSPQCVFIISTARGQRLFRLHSGDWLGSPQPLDGRATYRCSVRNLNLMPGRYSVRLRLLDCDEDICDDLDMAAELTVVPRDVEGANRVPGTPSDVMFMPCAWSVAGGNVVNA